MACAWFGGPLRRDSGGRRRHAASPAAMIADVVEQVRRGREVPVSEAVVDRLEVPLALPRLDVQGDDALGEEVVAQPVPAI